MKFLRQLLTPSKLCERLESCHTIRDATSHHREGAFRRDEAFKDDRPLLHALHHFCETVLGTTSLLIGFAEDEVTSVRVLGRNSRVMILCELRKNRRRRE